MEELLKRTGDFLEDLRKNPIHKKQTILVSTHGAALCALLAHIKGNDLKHFWGKGMHKNCAVTIVDCIDGDYKIIEEEILYYKDEVKPW